MSQHAATHESPQSDPFLDALLAGHAPDEIARQYGVPLAALAEYMALPKNIRAMSNVARLSAMHRSVLLASAQTRAIVTLAAIAADDSVPATSTEARARETRRRACSELLRVKACFVEPEEPADVIEPAPRDHDADHAAESEAPARTYNGNNGHATDDSSGMPYDDACDPRRSGRRSAERAGRPY